MKFKFNNVLSENKKIKFLFLGSLNFLISNSVFQILLFVDLLPVIISSLIFVIFYAVFGFVLYGKFLFNKKQIFKSYFLLRYFILLIISWLILNSTIYFGLKINFSASISSLIIMPFITLNSYLVQKFWVFK